MNSFEFESCGLCGVSFQFGVENKDFLSCSTSPAVKHNSEDRHFFAGKISKASCSSIGDKNNILFITADVNATKMGVSRQHAFHPKCLKCNFCQASARDPYSFDKKCWINKTGKVMCEDCHLMYRNCIICERPLAPDDSVFKLDQKTNCHETCMKCHVCQKNYSSGLGKMVFFRNSSRIECYHHSLEQTINQLGKYNNTSTVNDRFSDGPESEDVSCTYSCSTDSFNEDYEEYDGNLSNSEEYDSLLLLESQCTKVRKTSFMRNRTAFNREQTDTLRFHFENMPRPTSSQLENLSKRLFLPKKTIRIWFQNMRARSRKNHQKFNI